MNRNNPNKHANVYTTWKEFAFAVFHKLDNKITGHVFIERRTILECNWRSILCGQI